MIEDRCSELIDIDLVFAISYISTPRGRLVNLMRDNRSLITGYSYDPDCMYVNGTGRDYYEFYIQLNRCGTLGENTHHQDSRKNPTVRMFIG